MTAPVPRFLPWYKSRTFATCATAFAGAFFGGVVMKVLAAL